MAYNVAANMRQTRPGAAFLDRRDQVGRNALMERDMAGQEQAQAFSQQNALFERERQAQLDQADQAAAQEKAAKEQELAGLRRGHAEVQRILAAPAGQRRAVAMAVFDDEDREEFLSEGVDLDSLDDDGFYKVALQLENQIGSALGIGPTKPDEYTLGAGEKRFVNGKEVASVAPNPRSGMRIQSDGAGGFSLYEGPDAAGVDLTSPTVNKLQDSAVNAQAGIDRLDGIRQGFDPRWLTYREQFKQSLNSVRAKAQGLPFVSGLNPQEESDLAAFARFKSETTDNLNRYIVEITGAAMGVQEAKRIISTMPSLEDDPASFESKLDQTRERLRLVLARSVYTQNRGIKFDAIPIDQMKAIMNRRGDELYRENVVRLKDTSAARQATVDALQEEFFQ